jgi:hypothetical protein
LGSSNRDTSRRVLPEPLLMQSTDQAVIFNYAVLFMLMSLWYLFPALHVPYRDYICL